MNPTLDSIIADLENKILEGNFFDLYCPEEGEQDYSDAPRDDPKDELIAKNVNELFIKDLVIKFVTSDCPEWSKSVIITIAYPGFFENTPLPYQWISFKVGRNNKFVCHSYCEPLIVSNSLSETFDVMWRKKMATIQDELSREATRKLRLLLALRKMHSEPDSYFCSLAKDMSNFLIGPMTEFEM